MRRRDFIKGVANSAAAWPLAARAQQRFKIGVLDAGLGTAFTVPFMRKLGELGYVEGKNIVIEYKSAQGNVERLNEFAAELVRQQVDIIVTAGTPAGFAAKQATPTIPIVLGANADPVGVGLVASLARPGGNATGNSLMASDLSAKRLDILRTFSPGITSFAILWDSSNPGMAKRVQETKIAADQLRTMLRPIGPRNLDELDAAFAELLNARPDALLVTAEAFTRRYLARIVEFANSNKLPAMFEDSEYVEVRAPADEDTHSPSTRRRCSSCIWSVMRHCPPKIGRGSQLLKRFPCHPANLGRHAFRYQSERQIRDRFFYTIQRSFRPVRWPSFWLSPEQPG
jgi:putative tryptophan/tyrosine transport system substrate-binding protein